MITDSTTNPAHTYQWDAEGRLISVDGVAGQACATPMTWTECFKYNALGQRAELVPASGNKIELTYGAGGEELGRFYSFGTWLYRDVNVGGRHGSSDKWQVACAKASHADVSP